MKTSRSLTMCRKSAGDSRKDRQPLPSMPMLRLQGRWLDEAGFVIGMRVGVQVMPGRLVLETSGRNTWRSRRSNAPADLVRTDGPTARIPGGVIERLKTTVSVQRLAEERGVVLTKHGADLHGRCPFHEDRTPSLVITPTKDLWHCLGAYQTGGTVIDWGHGICAWGRP